MSNIPNKPYQKPYKDLTPFDLVLIQKFPFIERDFDAVNLYGILSKIVDYLNNVIANENIVTENQETLNKSFNDLYDYVNTYFTNLDVQEEINNKLDEMVQDGTLESIIQNVAYVQKGVLIGNLVHRDCSSVVKGVTQQSANNPLRRIYTRYYNNTNNNYICN